MMAAVAPYQAMDSFNFFDDVTSDQQLAMVQPLGPVASPITPMSISCWAR